MKKISIIVPFWKYLNYLKECFDSLQESTFKDFEVVLVLDHATENVTSVFPAGMDIKIVNLNEKKGCAAARNEGIKAATGEFIYFLDSDDYVLEDSLELLVNKIQGEEDVVYGTIKNTWNNKANFLDKQAKNEESNDTDDREAELEEKENARQEKIDAYVAALPVGSNVEKELAVYFLERNRKGISNFTVLGNLYRRSYIEENNLFFNEDFRYYSDMTFMCPALEKINKATRCKEAVYVKRKHNDPINKPALWQEENENRFEERCKAIGYTRSLIEPQGTVRYFIDMKFAHFATNTMAKKVRRSKDNKWRKEYFDMIVPYLMDSHPQVLDNLGDQNQKILMAFMSGDIQKVQKSVRFKLGKKKLQSIFMNKNINTLYKLAYYHVYLKQPIKENVVLFETFMAKNYSDSPKYIYEALVKEYGDQFTCVWAINNGTKVPYGAKTVKRFSFQYAYYLAISKYLVFNVRQPLWYRKREGQVFVETWHGTPLKRLVFDQEEVTSAAPKYKQQFYRQRLEWDYLVSANAFSTKTFRSCFMYDGPMLEYGYPRNDIMYYPNKDEIAKDLRTKLGIPTDKKTVLYAPTWRDDESYGSGKYKFTLALDLQMMKEKLGDEYVVLLRTHHYIADNIDTTGLEGFVYNLSKYDDISEIYLISDICITDYSSVFFDYANLKRPILFYTYDIEKYKNQLRGFYISMQDEVPGPLLMTSEEVIDAIQNIDQINEQYAERYKEFYNRFCSYDDGHASENIVKEVFGKNK